MTKITDYKIRSFPFESIVLKVPKLSCNNSGVFPSKRKRADEWINQNPKIAKSYLNGKEVDLQLEYNEEAYYIPRCLVVGGNVLEHEFFGGGYSELFFEREIEVQCLDPDWQEETTIKIGEGDIDHSLTLEFFKVGDR